MAYFTARNFTPFDSFTHLLYTTLTPATTNLFSVSEFSLSLFLRFQSYLQHNALKVCPCYCKWHNFFNGWIMIHIPTTLHPHSLSCQWSLVFSGLATASMAAVTTGLYMCFFEEYFHFLQVDLRTGIVGSNDTLLWEVSRWFPTMVAPMYIPTNHKQRFSVSISSSTLAISFF